MALANVTEGAARATVFKVTQTQKSHGFVAWQALVDGFAPKSSKDHSANQALAHLSGLESISEFKSGEFPVVRVHEEKQLRSW